MGLVSGLKSSAHAPFLLGTLSLIKLWSYFMHKNQADSIPFGAYDSLQTEGLGLIPMVIEQSGRAM